MYLLFGKDDVWHEIWDNEEELIFGRILWEGCGEGILEECNIYLFK